MRRNPDDYRPHHTGRANPFHFAFHALAIPSDKGCRLSSPTTSRVLGNPTAFPPPHTIPQSSHRCGASCRQSLCLKWTTNSGSARLHNTSSSCKLTPTVVACLSSCPTRDVGAGLARRRRLHLTRPVPLAVPPPLSLVAPVPRRRVSFGGRFRLPIPVH